MLSLRIQLQIDDFFTELPMTSLMKHGPFPPNLSKNNLIEQQKNYSGNIPSAEPYKFEYTYDADGYPVELVKHFKNYRTGEHLFKIKIVYTYM